MPDNFASASFAFYSRMNWADKFSPAAAGFCWKDPLNPGSSGNFCVIFNFLGCVQGALIIRAFLNQWSKYLRNVDNSMTTIEQTLATLEAFTNKQTSECVITQADSLRSNATKLDALIDDSPAQLRDYLAQIGLNDPPFTPLDQPIRSAYDAVLALRKPTQASNQIGDIDFLKRFPYLETRYKLILETYENAFESVRKQVDNTLRLERLLHQHLLNLPNGFANISNAGQSEFLRTLNDVLRRHADGSAIWEDSFRTGAI